MRLRNWLFAIIAVVIILPVAAAAVFVAAFNPNRYAPEIIAAVNQATGRQLTLGSPIQLEWSLRPTVQVSGVSLSNPPGFSGPTLLTLDRVEAQFSLLPLLTHKLNIIDLLLVHPQFNLESNAAGQANWDFAGSSQAEPESTQPALAEPAGPASTAPKYQVALEAVRIENGQVTLKGSKGQTFSLALSSLTGTAASPSAPLNLKLDANYNGTPFTVDGAVGPIERFSGIGSGKWPVDLTLNAAGASAAIKGGIRDPQSGHGYDVDVAATIPALETLGPLLPVTLPAGTSWPALHGLTVSARIVDQHSAIPAIDNLSIKAGTSDLAALRPGLALGTLDLEMASLDKPLALNASGTLGTLPLTFAIQSGPAQALLNPAWLPSSMPPQVNFPVALQATAGNANLAINGAIATPTNFSGVALGVKAAIPDLSALSPLAGRPLPGWKNIQLQTTVIDPGGLGLNKAAGLDSLALTMDNAALGGDASLYFGAQPRVQAAISGQKIDLDALLAALPPPAPATPGASSANAASPPPGGFVIPTRPLPLDALKTGSADIQFSTDTLVFHNATYNALQAHAVLANGVLTVNPLSGELPGGGVTASISIDATQTPAQTSLSLNAPALAMSPFLKTIGLPDTAQGTVQAAMRISGSGDSLHDIAASMNGQIGLASVNGQIDGAVLSKLLGQALSTVGLPANLAGAQGPVAIRCFGFRMDASNGVGSIRALTLDSSRLQLQGGGTVNFGPETLAIVLRPQLQVSGSPVSVPVQITGTFRNPVQSMAQGAALKSAANTAVGLASNITEQTTGSSLLGDLAAAVGLSGSSADVCPAALSLGRLGQPGPAAPPQSSSSTGAGAQVLGAPKNLLNSLFK